MNIRQKYELKFLLDGETLEMDKVAEEFNVLVKTIRNDVQFLNDFFTDEIGAPIILVKDKVACIRKENINEANSVDFSNLDYYTDKLSAEQRFRMIIIDLCASKKMGNIQELADKFFVSRATINKHIVEIKKYCKHNNIPFYSERGKGIGIEANEKMRRSYLLKLFKELSVMETRENLDSEKIYGQWFNPRDIQLIKSIVSKVEVEFNTYLADIAYEGLVLHIALSIQRYRQNNQLQDLAKVSSAYKRAVQYRMAVRIVELIDENFNIKLPDIEIMYVSQHIESKSSEAIKYESNLDASLDYLCLKLIVAVGHKLDRDLTNDLKLYDSLLQHLRVCMYRKKNNIRLDNPLTEELKERYPDLFRYIYDVLNLEIQTNNILVDDAEVAYMLIHFATAINRRMASANRLIDVVVVCSTGAGTSEMVVEGLRNHFKMNIKGALANHQLNNFLKDNDVDLIISTVPVKSTISSVVVRPILRREDVVAIGKLMLDLGFDLEKPHRGREHWSATAVWLQDLLKDFPGEDQEDILRENLKKMPAKRTGRIKETYMLSELLSEETIRFNAKADSWQQAVAKAGEPLIEKGAITQEYVDAIIQSVLEVGPYIVVTKGVALPHASNSIGVNETAMSFVRLAEPVEFGNKSNDPVKYVFMLASVDAGSHLGALADLTEFLVREEFFDVIEQAADAQEVLAYIKANEENIRST